MNAERSVWPIARALAEGGAIGAGSGAVAALLWVVVDPHRWVAPGLFLAAELPHALRAFAAAGLLVAGAALAIASTARAHARLAAWLLGVSVPMFGLLLALVTARPFVMLANPIWSGTVLVESERFFGLAFALVSALLVAPLSRWVQSVWRRAPSGSGLLGAVGAVVLAAGLLVVDSIGTGRVAESDVVAPRDARVLLIGIDGADWDRLRPLLERGLLPALGRLVEGGASGELATFRPTYSPLIWTTIATGQSPLRHGILNFLEASTHTPYTSNSRRSPALWNVLGERGIPIGTSGWWVSWPAERVHGWVVSSYSARQQGTNKGTLHEGIGRQTHPPELMDELRPLIAPALAAGRSDLDAILDGYRPPPGDTGWSQRVDVGSWSLGTDHIFTESALRGTASDPPRFLALYLSAPDTTSHLFCKSNPWRDEICGRIVEGVYRVVDRQLGRILEAQGEDATVIVVSDHGFDLTRGHDHGWLHGPPGIIVLSGPGVRAGGTIRSASVYDIAPTVLALFGLPIPEDLRGRPLLAAFEAGFAESLRVAFGAPLAPRAAAGDASTRPIEADGDAAHMERLRALGYIE